MKKEDTFTMRYHRFNGENVIFRLNNSVAGRTYEFKSPYVIGQLSSLERLITVRLMK